MTEAEAAKEWAEAWTRARGTIDAVARATGLTRTEAMTFMIWEVIDRSMRADEGAEDWKE